MISKVNNKGVSIFELIVVMAILGILVGAITPTMIKYVGRAKKVKVEKEASEFSKAAQIAYVDVYADGKDPKSDVITHITKNKSPYYKSGTLYGNLTNWTVHNGTVEGASNGSFAEVFFSVLGIEYGKGVKIGSSSVQVAKEGPKDSNKAGSRTKECVFQVFYDKSGNMIVEYSREGYFVRMENGLVMESKKISNMSEENFTIWAK